MIQKRYLSENGASKYTVLAVQTLRDDRFNKRGLSYCEKGRRVLLYDLEDLDAYMQIHKNYP